MELATQGTKTAAMHRDPHWKKWELFPLPLPQVDWSWPQTIRYFKLVLYWSAMLVFSEELMTIGKWDIIEKQLTSNVHGEVHWHGMLWAWKSTCSFIVGSVRFLNQVNLVSYTTY
jgi:hypothetical protein